MIRNEEQTQDKLKFFDDRLEAVHLKLANGRFSNGKTVEFKDNCIIFDDEKEGEKMIFLSEIYDVVKRVRLEE